ncbi:MAG: MAPEG family protein [Sinobacteraceae bacterium]|nr:MAPEG family protein [Nevskiaceae bacterium]
MPWIHLVLLLALAEFLYFLFEVGRARYRYGVRAPATTGHDMFERYYRVQMNTQEQLLLFIPSLLAFGYYLSPYVGCALGLVFILGRFIYFRHYVQDPTRRTLGFTLSIWPNAMLLAGGLFGAARAAFYF